MQVEFTALLQQSTHGRGTYHLVELTEDLADYIDGLPLARHGFQSIKVEAGIKSTTWKTSIFPTRDTYLLLIAKRLIDKENLEVGGPVSVTLEL